MQREKRVFIRFLLVGGSSTLLDYVLYWLLSARIHFNIAKCISMVCSCVYSFFLNKMFTFQDRRKTSISHVGKYIFSQCINIGTNVLVNAVIYELTEIKLLGMVCATGVAMIVNFLLQRFLVFNSEEEKAKEIKEES